MRETKYQVCLSVPLGKRSGTMLIHQSESRITGWLDILGNRNTFSGVCSKDGQMELSGMLQTLLSTIPYTAAGTAGNANLQLRLKTASGATYLLSGEELTPDDEVL